MAAKSSSYGLVRGALLAGCTFLQGCAWMMGHDVLPQAPQPFHVRPEKVSAHLGQLLGDARFLGPGERVATERNAVGRVARAVNPYGDDALVFMVDLVNADDRPASVEPSKARLTAELPVVTRNALQLDDFRHRWPTWAVDGPEQSADRGAAIGYVLDTLLLDRLIEGGARTSGRVAFALTPATERLVLTLPAKTGDAAGTLTFNWEVF
jgi:hypothetical protein